MPLKRFFLLLLLVAACLDPVRLQATHIVGGEMNYRYLNAYNYEIRLTVYRDCWVGVPPFDSPASLGIFDNNNNLLQQVFMTFLGLDTLPPTISDPCTIPPTNFCYEVTTYIDTVYLPPRVGGYQLVYQRCCRNQYIQNINAPQSTGATYVAIVPDTSVVTVDSNPKFNNWPPPFICSGKPLVFDHSAVDYDGDSLVYELYTPYEGADVPNPMPQPPNNPPYGTVIFIPPYSQNDMLGGTPMAINSSTGLLTATPNLLGYFVIGIRVKEYRNGIYIGETKRDFQFIVLACPKVVVAAATVPNVICGSSTVSFSNNSLGAAGYWWNFGDNTTTGDTSNLVTPSYLYPDTGTYQINMIAFAPNTPACNDTTSTTVTISQYFTSDFTFTQDNCYPQKINFTGTAASPPGTTPTWSWDLGDGSSESQQSFTHEYINAGTYNVVLIANVPGSLNCADTMQAKTVHISKDGNLFIPNTFTPNGDGHNDVFRIRGQSLPFFYLAVYNRWGDLVFESKDPAIGWDGTFKGMKVDPGVYGYYLKGGCVEEEEFFKKGNVTLIR
ncbi:MAG: PKD domain-containing protein [Bacteroidia bacterium]